MKDFELEACEIKNLDACLANDLIDFYNINLPSSPWSKAYFSKLLKKQKEVFCLIARKESEICGFILGGTDTHNICCLKTLVVVKKSRGQGLGSFLMKAFLTAAKNRNIKKVMLHYREKNDLEKFYTKFGFTNHRLDGTYRNGEKKHYMELILKK